MGNAATPRALTTRETSVTVPAGSVTLEGTLAIPDSADGVILFAHGSGSSRHSPRNRYVAEELRFAGFGTLLLDLLTPETPILPKMSFAATGDPALRERIAGLSMSGRDQVVICGTEAHVCVLQTALGLRAGKSEVVVVGDAVSSRLPESASVAGDRLRQAGCYWITAEMAVFEWLERAGTDAFRALLPLLK